MAEYLAPGVYVEEVSLRATAIDGVATFATGVLIGVAASIAIECLRRACNAGGRKDSSTG